jgi:hypothetical protein
MLHSRGNRALALALTASAVAAPAAIAQPIDRGAVQPDAATQRLLAQERYYEQDAPKVDGHHAALLDRGQRTDLRMPDTKDAALGRGLYGPTGATTSSTPITRVVHVTDGGMDWGDAAIGAGSAFGLSLLAAGAAAGLGRRRVRAQVS